MFPRRKKRKPLAKAQKRTAKRARRRPLKKSRFKQPISFAQSKNKKISQLRKKRFKGNIHINRILFIKRFLFGALIFSITAGLTYFIFFSQLFNLKKWEVIENDISFYNHYLDEFIKPYENENLIFLDTNTIAEQIATAHPNLSLIDIDKKLPDRLLVTINQYPLLANLINIVGEEEVEQKQIRRCQK